jgi:hypothetical protein
MKFIVIIVLFLGVIVIYAYQYLAWYHGRW